jgi:hypothetical protein
LLFEATHMHPANMCPLLSSEGKAMLKQTFSQQNMEKAGVKLEAAYFSCPVDSSADHKGFFTVDSKDAAAVKSYFGALSVDVRPVQTLAEVAKQL